MDTKPLAIAGALALLVAGGVGFALADTGSTPAAENATVSVSADATVERAPDRATVAVVAVGEGETAQEARDSLTDDDAIIDALETAGATVTSSQFSITPQYEYTDGGREQVGYVATHTIEAETDDVDSVGTLIDTAVDNGADRVEGISYGLDDDSRDEARDEAMTTAMENARSDAETLATAEDRAVGQALTIETTDSSRHVVRTEALEAADTGGSTEVSPGPITVRTSVQVTYELN